MDKKKTIYENVKLPKNWGKIRIGGKLVNPTVKEILTVQCEDNQDYRVKKICPDCSKKYVEEPKPECDHVLGQWSCDGYDLEPVYLTQLIGASNSGEMYGSKVEMLKEFLEREQDMVDNYCRDCGEKLVWADIKSKLTLIK